MADLQRAFQELRSDRVRTYIQSGNVLFGSGDDEERLRERIEGSLEERFGFPVQVVLRTASELQRIVENDPFSGKVNEMVESPARVERHHVALLSRPPRPEAVQKLDPYSSIGEEYRVIGREVYLWLPDGFARSKLAASLERWGVPLTVRNWRTMTKLNELART